ncbi:MAG TPA: alpha/beta hydrolase [Mycobacteriales bacterium]|nr:alpha/beta hydrolase [Mycobacteriales bacterium]
MTLPGRAGRAGGLAGRAAGTLGAAAGVLAAGAAVGVAVERYAIGRIRGPAAGTPPPARPTPDRIRTVRAGDGVTLYVEEDGPSDAPLTAVFVHGYCLNLNSWWLQRLGLADVRNPRVRRVCYDQRGHGRSGRGPARTATLDRLGEDLYELIVQVAPRGPVVLVGHSMGGMTVLALADRHPELFGRRPDPGPAVAGVALLSSSTGGLAEVPPGLPAPLARLPGSLTPVLVRGIRWRASMVERGRRAGGDLGFLFTRRYGFGSTDVSPWLVEHVGEMIAGTPVEVIADFLPAITGPDRRGVLEVLRGVPVLVLVGDRDRLTPAAHSVAIAERLPGADLVVVPGAGHLTILERPELVNLHLRAFLHRVARVARGGSASGRSRA